MSSRIRLRSFPPSVRRLYLAPWLRWLCVLLLLGRRRSEIRLLPEGPHVRMGWAFDAHVPRSLIRSATRYHDVWWGIGVVESVCVGLAIRDASMIAAGIPKRLLTIPAALLHLERAAGVVASVAGVSLLLRSSSGEQTTLPERGKVGTVRRAAVATLFALHAVRFGIYLRPGQGRR
jgi:hypothetical protein